MQAGKTRGEEHFVLQVGIEPLLYGGGQVGGLLGSKVHLPVARYHGNSFGRSHF